jgi:hypothetical protein
MGIIYDVKRHRDANTVFEIWPARVSDLSVRSLFVVRCKRNAGRDGRGSEPNVRFRSTLHGKHYGYSS